MIIMSTSTNVWFQRGLAAYSEIANASDSPATAERLAENRVALYLTAPDTDIGTSLARGVVEGAYKSGIDIRDTLPGQPTFRPVNVPISTQLTLEFV